MVTLPGADTGADRGSVRCPWIAGSSLFDQWRVLLRLAEGFTALGVKNPSPMPTIGWLPGMWPVSSVSRDFRVDRGVSGDLGRVLHRFGGTTLPSRSHLGPATPIPNHLHSKAIHHPGPFRRQGPDDPQFDPEPPPPQLSTPPRARLL